MGWITRCERALTLVGWVAIWAGFVLVANVVLVMLSALALLTVFGLL